MNRTLLILILFLLSAVSQAQSEQFEKPDLATIKRNIGNKQSPYFFPGLMKRFLAGDSTMNLEEKRHLYFGYAYQDTPYDEKASEFRDSLKTVLNKDSMEITDYDKILYYSGKILKSNPFDIRVRRYQTFAYKKTLQLAEADKNHIRNGILFDAIISTGNGISKEKAMHVIDINSEYAMITLLGLTYGNSQTLVDMQYDYLKVEKNKYDIEGLYFDTSISLNKLGELFKETTKKKRK